MNPSGTNDTRLQEAQHEILESRALLSAIVDGFEGFLYVSNADYRLSYLNAQCRHRVGSNAVGELCYKAIHRRSAVCPFCVQGQVLRGQTVRFEMMNPKDQRWYHSINTPIHHVDGTISLLAMVTDINDRKRAEIALHEAKIHLHKENIFLRSQITKRHSFGNIVGRSSVMQQVYEQILNAAASDATVVIYGEPGTGKELVARAIHDMSDRCNRHFVPVHCGAIPENLIESEFFGYKKGAFSGAAADKSGYLDFADGGTLLLDEVGEISLHMQIKLLRVIEGYGYTPVGSSQVKQSDARIIAATNRNLKERIAQRKMREDFFYRIHILPIHLPPLRERIEDLPLLIDHFMGLFCGKRDLPPITGNALETLRNYHWPGNIRELQNVIIRYCNQQSIDVLGLAPKGIVSELAAETVVHADPEIRHLAETMRGYEKQVILTALNQNRWHRQKVSQLLQVDRKTLFNKMRQHGLIEPKQ
jgi:transcriptional regulator with PAS, ATPase and Fis domain